MFFSNPEHRRLARLCFALNYRLRRESPGELLTEATLFEATKPFFVA